MPIQEGGRFTPNNRIVSPGVFTRENDLSGVAAGVSDIGGVVVAPFAKGPAFKPLSFTDINELQNQFGVPDGVYYGPYTAGEYLRERGLVTVCRVGGLTGYQQEYPIAIWATSGSWNRSNSAGALNSGSSYVTFSGSLVTGYSAGVTINTVYSQSQGSGSTGFATASFTSSYLTFTSSSFVVTFNSLAADDALLSITSQSGSVLYAGATVSLGNSSLITGPTQQTITIYSQSAGVPTVVSASYYSGTSSYYIGGLSSSFVSSSIVEATFSASLGTIQNLTFETGLGDDETLSLISASFYATTGSCGTPTIQLKGVLSGAFGVYDGTFTSAGPVTYDPCTNTWTSGSSDVRLLAVLADTQYAGISDLQAPGFYGSTMATASSINGTSDIPLEYNLTLKNTNSTTPYGVYQFSLDAGSTKYITNVFGSNPRAGNPATQVTGQKIEAAYLYKKFENAIAEIVADKTHWQISGVPLPSGSFAGEPMNFTDDYSRDLTNGDSGFSITNAITPWVLSQKIAPWQSGSAATRYNLFRVHTLADGTNTNTDYKIEISSVKLAGTVAGSDWGSFTLTLRKYSDTDKRPVIMESFQNCNLDPDSSNFVARRIGDKYGYFNYVGKLIEFGNFTNNSKHIRIEMNDGTYPITAVPYGFEAYATPINSAIGRWTPTMKYTKASVYGLNPGKYPSGISFDDAPTGADSELLSLYPVTATGIGAADDNKEYFAPLPVFGAYSSIGRNIVFALDDDYELYGVGTGSFLSGDNIVPAVYDAVNEPTYIKMRKFVFGFQNGFDGQSPAIPINVGGDILPGNTQGFDCTTVSSAGSIAYNQSITALGNSDEFDINLIVVPGILHQHHPYVTNLVVDMCEARGDCFFVMDMYSDDGNPTSGQIDEVVAYAAEYDTNYAATYYPWIKILDTNNNKIVTVPPSVVMPSVYAANDRVAAEWFAPAGLNRGGIPIATQVTDRTTHEERDTLYEGKVNPIAAFPGSGVVVWGQKTLQNQSSALDRVNVRRLLINIKKFFASTSKFLVFEQNVASTRNKFLSIVNPYLESVQQRSGLYAFFVKMDESNNTPDIVDRNILYGQIYLKPTKTAEFIVLDFNILPTGAAFANA
jgi:hypothetical protein